MIKLGTNTIGKVYLGSNSIGKAYLGSNLVFQKGSSPTPTPYTLVDYIETDGTAYIDTGVSCDAPISVEGKILPVAPSTGNYYVMGARKDSGDTRIAVLIISSEKKCGYGYANAGYPTGINIANSVNNATPFDFKAVLKTGGCSISVKQQGEGSFTTDSHTSTATITTSRNLYIFAWNNQGTASTPLAGNRFYSVKIYSDSTFTTLVWDGVPCIYNGEYGMWDRVSDTFFGNAAGSGAFTGPAIN